MNKTHIHDILKSWGKGKAKLPLNNSALKSEILAKVPFSTPSPRPIPTPYPWLSMTFATLAVIVFVGSSLNLKNAYPTTNSGITTMSYPMAPSAGVTAESSIAPDYYRGYQGNIPITDNREFLKTSYSANIKTRSINDATSKIEILVRGLGGRVDTSNSGEDYGYVSFAIPATKLEIFRTQVKELSSKKLITENTSSENLLPQKQSLETQRSNLDQTLASLKNDKTQLTNNHNKVSSSYSSRIKAINTETALLQNEWPNASYDRRIAIEYRLSELQTEKANIQSQSASANKNYQSNLLNINNQIKSIEENIGYVDTQDENLMDNLATVNGSISLDKVNLWEIADIYTPGPLLAWILALAALLAYFRHRRILWDFY